MQENYLEVNKAMKIKLYPTQEQEILFNQNINHVRFVFNKIKEGVEYHYDRIKEQGFKPRNLTTRRFCNMLLTQLKSSNDFLYNSDSTSLQASYENYIQSMKNFYSNHAKYPRFKSKRNPLQSFKIKNVTNSIRIENNKLRVSKHGFVNIRGLRKIKGKILSLTVSKIGDKWFGSIAYSKVIVKSLKKTGKSVGVDVGIKDLAILSDGQKITKLPITKQLKRINKYQKSLSNKIKDSNNYNKIKNKLTNAHYRLKCARDDYIHKLTYRLVNKYDTIVIEDLRVSNLLKNKRLSKHIQEMSWFEFRRQLTYKCEWYGKKLVIVNPAYTTKECNRCGYIHKSLTLGDRSWVCPGCDTEHDRDVNAAINIMNRWNKGDCLTSN